MKRQLSQCPTGWWSGEEGLARLVETLQQASLIAFDTETTATGAQQANLVGISLAWEEERSAYIPSDIVPKAPSSNFPLEQVIAALKPVLEDGAAERPHTMPNTI